MEEYIVILHSGNNNFVSYGYDENDFKEAPVSSYQMNEEELEEFNESNGLSIDDNTLMDNLEKNVKPSSKQTKHRATTMKKKKVAEKAFNIGDSVIYRKHNATVMFGPYERNYKQLYELQMEDGTVMSAVSTSIKKA